MTLAARLKALRAKLGISQTELADLVGVHRTWVAQVEMGKRLPSARNLARLAGALGCRTDDLLPPT